MIVGAILQTGSVSYAMMLVARVITGESPHRDVPPG